MSKLNRIAKLIVLRRWTYASWLVFAILVIGPVTFVLVSHNEFFGPEVVLSLVPGFLFWLIMWSLGRFNNPFEGLVKPGNIKENAKPNDPRSKAILKLDQD